MSNSQSSCRRKRLCVERPSYKPNGTPPPPPERSPTCNKDPDEWIYPAQFWDDLSKIWLTPNALRELDRRNQQSKSNQKRRPPQACRLFTLTTSQSNRTTLSTDDILRHYTKKKLKDMKWFAMFGGPDLRGLRGDPESAHTQTEITSSKRIGLYDRNFEQHLTEHGVYLRNSPVTGQRPAKPDNWNEINQILARRRSSLSLSNFPEEKFETFQTADEDVIREAQVVQLVTPLIYGTIQDARCIGFNMVLDNLVDLTDGSLSKAKPDMLYGALPDQIHLDIRSQCSGQIIPSTSPSRPIIPNFFFEAKAPSGRMDMVIRHACYDGALGARAMHGLQTYHQQEPLYDNNAYTITSTYLGGMLKIYAHHVAQSSGPGTRPEYYMHQLNAIALTGNRNMFLEGLAAFRNARDWTEAQRNAAIERANAIASAGSVKLKSEVVPDCGK